jgi:hypothetical protein
MFRCTLTCILRHTGSGGSKLPIMMMMKVVFIYLSLKRTPLHAITPNSTPTHTHDFAPPRVEHLKLLPLLRSKLQPLLRLFHV